MQKHMMKDKSSAYLFTNNSVKLLSQFVCDYNENVNDC